MIMTRISSRNDPSLCFDDDDVLGVLSLDMRFMSALYNQFDRSAKNGTFKDLCIVCIRAPGTYMIIELLGNLTTRFGLRGHLQQNKVHIFSVLSKVIQTFQVFNAQEKYPRKDNSSYTFASFLVEHKFFKQFAKRYKGCCPPPFQIHQDHILVLKSQRQIQDSKKALNIKYPSNFLKIDMKIKDAKNIIDGEDC
ncbi:hypothetical protein Tco_0946263 [Tanacetum coccineum]